MATYVFWDMEECPIPKDLIRDPDLIFHNINFALWSEGDCDSPTIWGYVSKDVSMTEKFLQTYMDAGITIFEHPADKVARVHSMLMHILFRLANLYKPINVMVISRNLSEATIYVLNAVMSRGVNVYLAHPGHKAISSGLLSHAARLEWCFENFLYGGKPLDQSGVEAQQWKKLRSVIVSSSSNPKSTENKDSEIPSISGGSSQGVDNTVSASCGSSEAQQWKKPRCECSERRRRYRSRKRDESDKSHRLSQGRN